MNKSLLAFLAAGSALTFASGAAAQTAVTDVDIVQARTQTVADVLLRDAMRAVQRLNPFVRTPNRRATLQGMVRQEVDDAIEFRALEVVNETIGLEQIDGLQFNRPGNKAGVAQTGLFNAATVDQARGRAGWALINQLGENTSAVVVQQEVATVPGPFSHNRAYVGQVAFDTPEGADFTQLATVFQTYQARDGATAPNHVVIQQGGIRALTPSTADLSVRAVGSDNQARVDQSGAGNDVLIQQGTEQGVFAFMLGDAVGRNNRARVDQVGTNNAAVLGQEDDSTAVILQHGFSNLAILKQDGYVDLNENWAEIEQRDTLGRIVTGNLAAVAQYGYNARSTVRQHSDDNEAYVDQTFRAAEAESLVVQKGGMNNFVSVVQDVGDLDNAYEGRLISTVHQDGRANIAVVSQKFAAGSRSHISQTGDRNRAQVSQ